MTYITENLIGLSGPDGVLLLWMARPLVQVGAVEDITQHVLATLSYLVGDDVRWEVDFGLGLVVVLLVDPLLRHTTESSESRLDFSRTVTERKLPKPPVLLPLKKYRNIFQNDL